MATTKEKQTIIVNPIQTETITFSILGTRPVIVNRLSEKARRELLMPSGRKNAVERATTLKHNPYQEFRDSPYTLPSADAPTYLAALSAWFKAGMMSAALRLPGTKKTEIAQLVWVEGERPPLYGIPQLFMAPTRSADMNKTPDIRTRCIVPRWATEVHVTYVTPLIDERSVVNLMIAAGQIAGVGDWRPEKGSGTFGQFAVVDHTDERFRVIVETGGRAAQLAAMEDPECYNEETAELLSWFDEAVAASGKLRAA